jgi:hypothetical protein
MSVSHYPKRKRDSVYDNLGEYRLERSLSMATEDADTQAERLPSSLSLKERPHGIKRRRGASSQLEEKYWYHEEVIPYLKVPQKYEQVRNIFGIMEPPTQAPIYHNDAFGLSVLADVSEDPESYRRPRPYYYPDLATLAESNLPFGSQQARSEPSADLLQKAVKPAPAHASIAPAPFHTIDPQLPTPSRDLFEGEGFVSFNLPGNRPTRILVGCWSRSIASNDIDKHTVYGILEANDDFRMELVHSTRIAGLPMVITCWQRSESSLATAV